MATLSARSSHNEWPDSWHYSPACEQLLSGLKQYAIVHSLNQYDVFMCHYCYGHIYVIKNFIGSTKTLSILNHSQWITRFGPMFEIKRKFSMKIFDTTAK